MIIWIVLCATFRKLLTIISYFLRQFVDSQLKLNFCIMEAPKKTSGCDRFAGRVPAGLEQPIVLKKNGVRHVSRP